MRKNVFFWSGMIVLPMVVGLIVYLILKPSAYVSELIIDILGLRQLNIQTSDNWFLSIIRNYLCDFLWAFSLTAAISLLYYDNRFRSVISVLICLIVGIIIELLQLWGVISGTFDIVDLIVQSIGSILSIIISKIYLRGNKNEAK